MIRMTSNTTPPPFVASASSEHPNGPLPNAGGRAFCAFDGNINNAWQGDFPGFAYLQFDYGIPSSKPLSVYTISMESFFPKLFPGRTPRDWTIEASNDLLTWDVIDTRTGQTWGSFANPSLPFVRTYHCDVSDGTKYQYFRMNITANQFDNVITVTKWVLGPSWNRVY